MKISQLEARRGSFAEVAVEYLNTLPDDEVVDIHELATAIGLMTPTGIVRTSPLFSGYSIKLIVGGTKKWLYGNKKAIKALEKKTA